MRSFAAVFCMQALVSIVTCSFALHERDIRPIGRKILSGNVSNINAWTARALSYTVVNAVANDTSSLRYLCANWETLTSRYASIYASPAGDVTLLSKETICGASNSTSPWSLASNLWNIQAYLSGTFIVQTYAGIENDTNVYASMCFYLESSLMNGLWLPYETDYGFGVNIEGSLCAKAGLYDTSPEFQYTKATDRPSLDVQTKTTNLVSKMLARGLQVVLKSEEQVKYICARMSVFSSGLKSLGLDHMAIEDVLCRENGGKIMSEEAAKMQYDAARSDLFDVQLLNAGNENTYLGYLCEELKPAGMKEALLDGDKIYTDACKIANGTGT